VSNFKVFLSCAYKVELLFVLFQYLRQLILLLWDLHYVLFQVATASQFFISYTIRTFGALTFATIMTTRQVDYIGILSVIILADNKVFSLFFFSNNSCPCIAVACEHIAVLHLVCTSSQLDAVGWRGKSPSTSVSPVASQYVTCFRFNHGLTNVSCHQAIVFVALYTKSFLRSKPQKLAGSSPPRGSSPNPVSNSWQLVT
jgi:hypothetical protein